MQNAIPHSEIGAGSSLIAVGLMREEPLGTRSGIEIAREAQPQAA